MRVDLVFVVAADGGWVLKKNKVKRVLLRFSFKPFFRVFCPFFFNRHDFSHSSALAFGIHHLCCSAKKVSFRRPQFFFSFIHDLLYSPIDRTQRILFYIYKFYHDPNKQ